MLLDEDNQTDNLGFVFTSDLNFDDLDRTRDRVAAAAARRAAFFFGAHPIEASVPEADGNVASLRGADIDGNRLPMEPTKKRSDSCDTT